MRHNTPRFLTAAATAVLAGSLVSCGSIPLRDVQTFGRATDSLATQTSEAFEVVNEWTARRKVYDAALDPTYTVDTSQTDNVNRTNLRGIFDPPDAAINTPPFREQIRLRIQALGLLGDYAGSLETLASADVSEQIDEASLELRGSLKSLRDTYSAIEPGAKELVTDESLDTIALAVNAIGKAIAEQKRRAAIREVIIEADPAVQTITALIAEDISGANNMILLMEQSAKNARASLQQAYNTEKASLSFEQRKERLEELRVMYLAEITMKDYGGAIVGGAKKVGSAHAKLRDAAANDDLSLDTIRRDVEDLVGFAKDIEAFREKIKAAE